MSNKNQICSQLYVHKHGERVSLSNIMNKAKHTKKE